MSEKATPSSNAASLWDLCRQRVESLGSGRLAAFVGLLALTALVYWPSSVALDGYWTDTIDHTYTHGYLVLLTSIWLVWRDRAKLDAAPARPMPLALPALVLLSAAWLFFWKAAIQDAQLLLLPIIVLVALLAILGRAATRVLLFPVCYLYFAMPAWSDLVDPLQHLSSAANGVLIWLTGLPAYMDGNLIRLPAGTLEIAEGCSGMHFLIVGLALAALYGEIMRDSRGLRILWLALMGVLSLVANWLRIFVVAVAAYETQMRSSLVAHHYWFGWLVFAFFFAAFLWMADRIERAVHPLPGGRSLPTTQAEAAGPVPASAAGRLKLARCVAAVACLGVLPVLTYARVQVRGSAHAEIRVVWPAAQGSWTGPLASQAVGWVPDFHNATVVSRRRYIAADGESIELFVAAYRTQSQDGKLVAYGNSLLGSAGDLRVVAEHTVDTPAGKWRAMVVADPSGDRSVLWSQYRIGGRTFARGRVSQLWYGIAAFASEPVSSLVAIRTACEPGCSAAAARVAAAAAKLEPSLALAAHGAKEGG